MARAMAKFLLLLLLALLNGCMSFPATRSVTGVLTRVQHDESKEAHCSVLARLKDPSSCNVPPVCCAYKLTVQDSIGKEFTFYAFWPKWSPGITGLVPLGSTAHFKLHRREVFEFPCTMYGCRSTMDYTLDSDEDVKP